VLLLAAGVALDLLEELFEAADGEVNEYREGYPEADNHKADNNKYEADDAASNCLGDIAHGKKASQQKDDHNAGDQGDDLSRTVP